MELTEEQYNRIFKFVDKEMDEAEYAAFKVMISQDEALNDEVDLYKEIQSLGASINQKLSTPNLSLIRQKSDVAEVDIMIKNARERWENQHENDLKLRYGISAIEGENTITEVQIGIRTISLWAMLTVAASVLGLIFLSITWYLQDRKGAANTAINNKRVEAQATANKPADSLKNIFSPLQPEKQNEQLPPVPIAKQESNKTSGQRTNRLKPFRIALIQQAKNDALFTAHFEPDLAPQDKEGPLKTALLNYENKNYSEAIKSFERVDLGPVTRGEAEDSRIILAFKMHYYKALSNMAADTNISSSISELKNALRTRPDTELQTRTQWYLALAYLKKNDINRTMQWLTKLVNKNASPVYQQKALQLIKQLQ